MKLNHADMSHFPSLNNELIIGGRRLAHIEKMVGRTPFYVYDKSFLTDTVKRLTSQLPSKIKVHYAIKANPYPALVHYMKSLVSGFDVASTKEMLLAIQTGMDSADISFAGPGKTEADIEAAIIAGVTLHVESSTELSRVIDAGALLNLLPQVAIRVNPAFELKASGMKMSGGAKPFGIDEEQLPNILATLDYTKVNFRGFHIYAGSQNLNSDAIIDMHKKTFDLAEQLVNLTPVKIDYINIGGGLGIPYFSGDKRLELATICENLEQLLTQYQTSFDDLDIVMELGRYLVGEAGIYVSKVCDIKQSRGTKYAVCDGGLHHHLSNSGNFGQVIRKNYPVVIGNKLTCLAADLEQVNIVGPLCTPLDVIADKVNLPPIAIGDYIVVYQSGAYGASASPKDFLSQPNLSEIFL